MIRNDVSRPQPNKEESSAKSYTAPLRQELNHPVLLDEFDRRHMGLAAKE